MLQIVKKTPTGMSYPLSPRVPHLPSIHDIFTRQADILAGLGPNQHTDIYVTLGHMTGAEGSELAVRNAASFAYQEELVWDIDSARIPNEGNLNQVDRARAFEYLICVADVLKLPQDRLTLVSSGKGLHVYVFLAETIKNVKYFAENKLAYNEICRKIGVALKLANLPFDKVDPTIFEPARIIRLPGTINSKNGVTCTILQYANAQFRIDLKETSGIGEIEKENISLDDVRRIYPTPDAPAIVDGCAFIQWCLSNVGEVHEPHFFDLVSILGVMRPDVIIAWQNETYTPRELARYVFERASGSASLSGADFDAKWDAAIRYGVRRCKTIEGRWEGACIGCPHQGRIASPVAIKSKDHIATEAMGFWKYNKEGNPTNPAYEDLAKVFRRETPYFATETPRLFVYDAGLYSEVKQQHLKNWVTTKVQPTEPLVDRHCVEFVKRVEREGYINSQREDHIFNQSIMGKLNCKNGILDIRTGQLLPHGPEYGFLYQLPYDYTPDQTSEFFLDWLGTVMCNNTEFMECLLDVIDYCLWPSFDDHVFTYFVGGGKNGKSTVLKLIQALVGKNNFSAINMKQLTQNRFAPANLEGKLVNLSAEAGTSEISYDDGEILKALTGDDQITIERKNEQGYEFQNKAKLIFSANKPPIFREQTDAIKRRLLVIPFNHTIAEKDIDPSVGKRLLDAIPAIMSMSINRIQKNIAKHDGYFRINRAGIEGAMEQEKLFRTGNSVWDWAKDVIESHTEIPDTEYLVASELYRDYDAWCKETGHKNPQNRNSFARSMSQFVMTPAGKDTVVKRVNSISTRIYIHCRRKEKIV